MIRPAMEWAWEQLVKLGVVFGPDDRDRLTAAIEVRDREWVEAAAEKAVEVAFRLTGCGIATLAEINREVRALIPAKDPSRG